MKNLTATVNGKAYKQVSKAAARKAFTQGTPVILTPCNIPFSDGCHATLGDILPERTNEAFDYEVYAFNKSLTHSMGRHPHYFIPA